MSLFSTIAHHDVPQARGFSPKRVGIAAVGIALGITVGFVIATNRTADLPQQTTAAVTGLAYEDFVRLNTTDMPNMSPAAPVYLIEPQPVVDPFIQINTTSFDGLVPAASVQSERVVDPNFLYWNTTALDNMVPAAANQPQDLGNTTKEFLWWNITSLEYPPAQSSEQSTGPR